ncbi:STAS/SEC14 domain-containing protein [Thalassotalea maritima]|uniref:STAS/SEC14 domain-containing protein n=1 Tax=Thalassotalea maritima TaxID=3242416 RepID=UPI0035280866
MITHGLSIGLQRINDDVFVAIKAIGTLTYDDYQRIVPILDSAFEQVTEPKIKVLFDATEFDGWELRAAWDDLKLGIRHGSKFDKIALIGSQSWQQWAAKVSSWFIDGEVQSFTDKQQALDWLLS